jgi:hypothetical protein
MSTSAGPRNASRSDRFNGIYCLDRIAIPENRYVLFDFDCKPGTLCFVKPAFLTLVNIVDSYVIAIIDPYIPTEISPSGATTVRCGRHGASQC